MRTPGHDLALRGVTFAYGPHAEPVLRDLDLTVPDGDHLAVVGPSGIGKSTLAGLLCGLLRPDSGTVFLGGATTVELPPDRLAEIRTLIPQEAYVFAGTVWDNLTYLCTTATTRQVENAVAALGAEALLAKLGGISAELCPPALSAGERQLIALMRAYVSAAPVIVLDEATCHLDPAAERRAEEAFASRGGTLIVIAHRVSSALRARRILVLDGINAVAGDHLTLLSSSPLYRELLGHWQVGATAAAVTGQQLVPVGREQSRVPRGHEPERNGAAVFAGRYEQPVVNRLDLTNGEHMARDTEPAAEAGAPPAPGRPDAVRNSWRWRRRVRRDTSAPVPSGIDLADEPTTTGTPPPGDAPGPASGDEQHRQVIFGRVTEDGSTPLPGATVTLTDLSGRQLGRDSSDTGGHYQLDPPTGGSYLVVCASASHQPTAALVVVAGVAVRHDVMLSGAGASLSGSVCAAGSGQPLAEAVVTLVDIHGDVVAAAGTEPDGCFTFVDLPQGHYTLTVAVPSLQPVARSVEVPAHGHVTHDVEMATRVQLRGVVRTATAGIPVPEALATVIAPDGQVVGSVATDAAGGFIFDDLDPGTYTVIATGYPPVATEVHLDARVPTETVITLRPPTSADAAAGNGTVRSTEGDSDGYGSG